MNLSEDVKWLLAFLLLTSNPQAFYTPVFTFTDRCLDLHKHWQQLFCSPIAMLAKSAAISQGYFIEVQLEVRQKNL